MGEAEDDGAYYYAVQGEPEPSSLQEGAVMPRATFGWFVRDLLDWWRNRKGRKS